MHVVSVAMQAGLSLTLLQTLNKVATGENLCSGFPISSNLNQPAQLQRLARIEKVPLEQVLIY